MASKAIVGVGTKFRRWNTTLVKWENIAEISSITGPSMSRDTIDVTSMDSLGGYREFIPGFRKAGTTVLKMHFTRDTYDRMKSDFESNTAQNYNIIFPDVEQTSLEFEGFVTDLPVTATTDAVISMDVTIQITGQVLVDSGASTGI